MNFANSHWLWGLVVIPILYLLLVQDEKRKQRLFSLFADKGLWRALAPEIDLSARLRKSRVLLLAFALVLVALARPQWGSHEEVTKASGLDVMVVLDVSNSMEVEDAVPSRLKKAKHMIRRLVEQLRGDRVGLITFAASSYVACPLTTDLDYMLRTADSMEPKMIAHQGTDIGIGLETAMKAMKRGAEDTSTATPSRAIVLFSDGEDHEGGALDTARQLKDSGIKLYAFGIGTQKGGPVPTRDENGNLLTFKKDRKGQPVVSSFHPDDLTQIAATAGGRYWSASVDEAEVDEALKDLGALNRAEFGEHRYVVYEERFQIPLFLAVLLILLELGIPARRVMKESRPDAKPQAKGFATLALLVLFLSVRSAQATPLDVYLDNKKGLQEFNSGKLEDARRDFGAAQAREPSLPELKYNEGVIELKEGNLDQAIQSFQDSYRASEGQDKPGLGAQSLFNLGSALTQKHDLKGAVESYLKALPLAEKSGDAKLEADLRKNIELLVQEKKKQQQQQQQQQQNQDQKKQDQQKQDQQKQDQQKQDQQKQDQKQAQNDKQNQDQKKDGDKQKEEDQNKQKNYRQNTQEERSRSFKSKKLNDEDAEKVMAELTNRERELQAKLRRQHAEADSNQKDW